MVKAQEILRSETLLINISHDEYIIERWYPFLVIFNDEEPHASTDM